MKLLDTNQAAEVLNLSPGTLTLWRHRRKGPPFVRCGSAVRYLVEDLEAWLREQRVEPSQNVKVEGG